MCWALERRCSELRRPAQLRHPAAWSRQTTAATSVPLGRGVVAEPTHIPPPIKRNHPIHHEVTFEGREVEGEIEPGAKFSYMTFNGQVPRPMIRVRQRDTITLTLRNDRHSTTWHSIDHAMTRALNKGVMAEIEVTGEENPEIFNAKPLNSPAT